MNPFGRLRWFLGRLISPVRTIVPGSTPSAAGTDASDLSGASGDPAEDDENEE